MKIIKIVFILTACKKSGPVQQMLNIIMNLDRNLFDPHLVTLYPEPLEGSQLNKFLPFVIHHFAKEGKVNLILGRDYHLRKVLNEIKPDVIHSLGVFPDFAISRMKKWNQIITLRNYVYDDYPAKFGKFRGTIMAKLHLYAMQHTSKTVTCSESLASIYNKKLGLNYEYVRNGVDIERYSVPSDNEKHQIRIELKLPPDSFIYVYTGQMIERKNVDFLLESYISSIKAKDGYLLLLGGGTLLDGLKEKYGDVENVDLRGSVENVNYYLKACDAYVSTSKSEGLPNGVLEAMATGLPVVLSDIEQHLEIYNVNQQIGYCYKQGDSNDFANKLRLIRDNAVIMGNAAYICSHEYFSAQKMSLKYQDLYKSIVLK